MSANGSTALNRYLATGFESPEPDFVRGELIARSAPDASPSRVQVCLADAFKTWNDRKRLFRAMEIRLRVAPDKFRVADFAVFASKPIEAIPESAPYAVVEIVSPDDRYEDLMSKLADYDQAGVEFIFVADPPTRKLSRYRNGDLISAAALELDNYAVAIPLDSIFH